MFTTQRLSFALTLALAILASSGVSAAAPTAGAVVKSYGDLAETVYGDALAGAKVLETAVDRLIGHPSPETLKAAREAWKAARVPYLQSEGFRFGNSIVDDWEGKVNAWPLDEGLIDYVAPNYGATSDSNPLYTLNVIAKKKIRIGPDTIDASRIDGALLRRLHESEDVEANVATGYHAIEFLLWGQDLHGTKPGAGERPYTDYDLKACTGGHCDRRAAYLKATVGLLIADLTEMTADWAPNGPARTQLAAKGGQGGLSAILTGISSLSYGELAGERMKTGLTLHDPEQEQDCFSDNTHNSHYNDEQGIINIWSGSYKRPDGSVFKGASLRDYAMARNAAAAKAVDAALAASEKKFALIRNTAESGRMAYDQMIGADNPEGNKMVQDAIDGLIAQTRAMQKIAADLKLTIAVQDSDSFHDEKPSAK